jgi:hypothetical protein
LVTTVLPLRDGRVVLIRKASVPDSQQALMNQNLGIRRKTAFHTIKSYANR